MLENARELVTGRHRVHYEALAARLAEAGYDLRAEVHLLSERGLPQRRERALVVACRDGHARTLGDLWRGRRGRPEAATVRTALARLDEWREAGGGDPDSDEWPGVSEAVRAARGDAAGR